MANTLNLGTDGNWGVKKDSLLGYNSENGNYKPLPFDFTRASSATVVNKDGLIETIGSGEPRIDFKDNTKGALLLEPERSNFMPYSNGFDNVAWDKGGGGVAPAPIVSANQGISPDGTNNAFKVELNLNGGTTSSDRSRLTDNFTGVTSTDYTFSFYAKAYSSSEVGKVVKFSVDNSTGDALFTLTSEWKRFVFVGTSTGTNINQHIQLRGNESTSDSVTMLLYGYQAEQGSYATSYIPTSGGTVTRVADATIGNLPSSSIGQSEGVVYFEGSYLDTSEQGYIQISDGTSDNRIIIWNLTSTLLRGYIVVGGDEQAQITGGIISNNTTFKVALKYKTNDFALWFNGVEVGVNPNGSTFGSNVLNKLDLHFSSVVFKGEVKDLKLYNTALTNAELQALTTI